MKLAQPFYRLPLRFDAQRLQAEIALLPAGAWAKHPNEIPGNSSVRLISVNGEENDEVNGVMQPTAHLKNCPYIRQVLASFGVAWSRSRLLRLAPGAVVPQHADINYHWFNRVRVHIPIQTQPEVRFYSGDASVHMAAGEAWVFDNWRLHRVENPSSEERIHLVADTSGSAAFWQLVARADAGDSQDRSAAQPPSRKLRFDPGLNVLPLTERTTLAPVMHPAEVDVLILDLNAELVVREDTAAAHQSLERYRALLSALRHDWRQLYALYGASAKGWPEFTKLRDGLRDASRTLAEGLMMRTNRVAAHSVLEGRVLRAMLSLPNEEAILSTCARGAVNTPATPSKTQRTLPASLERPIFIIAAPRSGSTLLFETLAASEQLWTLGGEAHWLIESLPELRPGAPRVDSNRLEAHHATDAIATQVVAQLTERSQELKGTAGGKTRRFLEKTPKNALRIPFLNQIFPDARFVFLWRDPRESLSSIIEAWRSGNWKTYNGLQGFDGPWSLLLPPGWQTFNGKPLEEIAAYQWECTNRLALEDLTALSKERWTAVNYAQLTKDPETSIRRLCEFLQLNFDAGLAAHLSQPLPLSQYTSSAPDPDKWRAHEATIERVLPSLQNTWARLKTL